MVTLETHIGYQNIWESVVSEFKNPIKASLCTYYDPQKLHSLDCNLCSKYNQDFCMQGEAT